MRLFTISLRLIIFIILHRCSTAKSVSDYLQSPCLPKRDINLGNNVSFIFTTEVSMFWPIEPAAFELEHLYRLAQLRSIYLHLNPHDPASLSPTIAFRLGQFALVFKSSLEASESTHLADPINWQAIAVVCAWMVENVSKGQAWYYNAWIRNSGPDISMQVVVMSDMRMSLFT